jgi:isopropylmalate/homocitrate/citramalate synthase
LTTEHPVNPEKKYYNFQGKLPPVNFLADVAVIPPAGPQNSPKLITDTTLRDGAQDPRFAVFPNETKLKYFDLLHKLDNGTGRIEAVEVFIYQKRDLWTLEKLLARGYDYPVITTWTRATPKDIKLLVKIGGGRIKETGMLASSSDHHIFDKLDFRSKQEAVEKYLVPILTACEHGIKPRVHLEDVTKADIEGWVIPFIQRTLKETEGLAHFRLCDTLGIGVPDPWAEAPQGLPRLVSTIAQATGAELEFHGHNDFGLATANCMAAFRFGCKRVNVSIAGLGERTGNAALEQVVANYVRFFGDPGFNLEALREMEELVCVEVTPTHEKMPIIGKGIFGTQAGLHQTGLQRQQKAEGGLIYLPFDPALLGRTSVELNRIGALSGMDGLVAILNSQWEAATGEKNRFSLTSRVIKQIYDIVHDSFDGLYDPPMDMLSNYRTSFWEPQELLELAQRQLSDDGIPKKKELRIY